MSDLDALVAQIPLSDLAARLGIPEGDAERAVRQVVPALLGGMAVNVQDPDGAASLEEALGGHASSGPLGLDDIDTADGQKIVDHVLGSRQGAVADQLGGSGDGSGGSGLIARLLPILAPIVMRYLAERFTGGSSSRAAGEGSAPGGAGGLGDVLGGLLEGAGSSGGLGGVLGDILGGRPQ